MPTAEDRREGLFRLFAGYLIEAGQTREVSILLTQSQDALLGTELLREQRVILDFGTGEAEIIPSGQ